MDCSGKLQVLCVLKSEEGTQRRCHEVGNRGGQTKEGKEAQEPGTATEESWESPEPTLWDPKRSTDFPGIHIFGPLASRTERE